MNISISYYFILPLPLPLDTCLQDQIIRIVTSQIVLDDIFNITILIIFKQTLQEIGLKV